MENLPKDFNWEFYLDFYNDLRSAGLKTEQDAINHYLDHGYLEKRSYKEISSENFNYKNYILLNTDLLINDIHSESNVRSHYVSCAEIEKRPYSKIENNIVNDIIVTTPIYLFYHIWVKNDWYEIFLEQIEQMQLSGLWQNLTKIFINVIGQESDKIKIINFLNSEKVKVDLVNNNFEFPTLIQIREISQNENFKGIYIHSKSTSYSINHPDKWKYHFWRKLMNYQILNNWKSCYYNILSHDLVGTLFRRGICDIEDYWKYYSEKSDKFRFTDHFSGNFFWFDSEYFSKLPILNTLQKENRFNAEWYPFSNHPKYIHLFNDFDLWIKKLEEKIEPEYQEQKFKNYSLIKNHKIKRFDVSVIISLHNYQDYIKSAVGSVMMDETKPLTEIVIVNDCSTDESLTISKSLLNTNHNITLINKLINTGLVETRNIGISNSSGDYVFILDSDNQIYENCLIEHFNFLKQNTDFIACYSTIKCFNKEGNLIREVSNDVFNFEKLKNSNYIDAMAMFDKKKIIEIGLYDNEIKKYGIGWEDYELWLRIGSLGEKVGFINKTLSRYLVKEDSMLSETNEESNKKNLIYYLNNKYNANIQ